MSFNQFEEMESDIRYAREQYRENFMASPDVTFGDFATQLDSIPITFDTYQIGTNYTAQYPKSIPEPVYLALGVGGESGELQECVKKLYRNKDGIVNDEFIDKLKKEAGDVLFYLSALMLYFGIKMSDVANTNQIKLADRQKRGKIKSTGDNR